MVSRTPFGKQQAGSPAVPDSKPAGEARSKMNNRRRRNCHERDAQRGQHSSVDGGAKIVFLLSCLTPNLQAQRDRGVNQPGAAGNRSRDPGIKQPGAAGNVGRDPGFNQPGAMGNSGFGGSARQTRVAGDPGINQPGAAGNVGRDPGVNQPGAAGNRR